MPNRLTQVALALLVTCAAVAAPARASACDNSSAGAWTTGTGAEVAASCGQTQPKQTPVVDAVARSKGDKGVSTNFIPQVKEPAIPQPFAMSCNDLIENCPAIPEPATPAAPPPPGAPPAITTAVLRQAAAQITLPPVDPKIGPDPTANTWGIVAIGYPIWLWTPGTNHVTATTTAQGITVTITATRTHTTFDMGDGTTITCTTMTPYPGPTNPPQDSPTCGYRYPQLPQTPTAGYDLRATTHWNITWTALGQTGTFTMTRAATRHLDIAELHTLITAR